jgi:hypothetical protein
VQSDLDGLVGLDTVKSQMTKLVNSAVVEQERAAFGKPVKPKNRNLLFSGPRRSPPTT